MILKYECVIEAQLGTHSLGKMFVDINKIFCLSKVHRIWSDRCHEVFCLNCAVMTDTDRYSDSSSGSDFFFKPVNPGYTWAFWKAHFLRWAGTFIYAKQSFGCL